TDAASRRRGRLVRRRGRLFRRRLGLVRRRVGCLGGLVRRRLGGRRGLLGGRLFSARDGEEHGGEDREKGGQVIDLHRYASYFPPRHADGARAGKAYRRKCHRNV